jgi:hypothetical protein
MRSLTWAAAITSGSTNGTQHLYFGAFPATTSQD